MKKIFWVYISLLGLIIVPAVFAQETMTLTTFYPSPIGAYDRIRLVPRTTLVAADCDEVAELGLLYYDSTSNVFQICIDDGGIGWQILTASGGGASLWTQIGDDLYTTDFANPNLNVGIGIDLPLAKLHISDATNPLLRIDPAGNTTVDPTIWLRDTVDTAGFKIWYDNNVGSTYFDNLYNSAAGDVHFRTKVFGTPVDVLTLESAGNVGIGTLNPGQKLEVVGSILASDSAAGKYTIVGSNSRISTYSSGADTYFYPKTWSMVGAKFGFDAGAAYIDSYLDNRAATLTPGPIRFKTGGTDRAIIDDLGNVGIGTSNPGEKLHVYGSGDMKIEIESSSSSPIALSLRHGSDIWLLQKSGVDKRFRIYNYPGGGERFTILSGGNVGIGTANPQVKLDVAGNASIGSPQQFGTVPKLYVKGSGGPGEGPAIHGIADPNYNGAAISGWGGPSGVGIRGYSDNIAVEGRAFTANGIGVQAVGITSGSYDFYAAGVGTDYGSSSSIRWKENITEIDNAIDKILNIRGVYFDWDKEHGGQHDMGFIAEEVGEYIPEIVNYEKNSVYATGLDYGAITPVLVEAIKELKKESDELKKRIEELEQK